MSRPIYVIGHKHSDLDSVAAAYGYARLLQLRGEAQPIAARQGELKPEVRFVLQRFHVDPPPELEDVYLRVCDVMQRQMLSISLDQPLLEAGRLLQEHHRLSLPVVDAENKKRSMMNLHIRPFSPDDMEDVVQLSLLAWAPVYHSFEQVLGAKIYSLLFPDWKKTQRAIVEKICREHEKTLVWVAEAHGMITGFIAYTLNSQENGQDNTGEVELLAVHPDDQNHGIGTELNHFALEKMKESGMKLAIVATGGDPGHAPARRTYEKAGYTALPGVRYYQDL